MKYIKLVPVIFSVIMLLMSCSGNSTTNAVKDTATTVSASANASAGVASFSYKIDGVLFSGNGTDNTVNCAFKREGSLVHFVLMSIDPGLKAPPQFSFSVADKGTTTIGKDDMEKYSSGNGVKYFANFSVPPVGGNIPDYEFNSSITVVITPGSSSRLRGAFSGNLINPDTKKVALLTDGIFDLPFSSPLRK